MKSAREALPVEAQDAGRARLPAGGPRDLVETPPSPTARLTAGLLAGIVLCRSCVGRSRQGRHRCLRAGQDRAGRPREADPATRDQGGAGHSRARRSNRQGRRDLIELDPTSNQAELQHLKSDLLARRSWTFTRTRAALDGVTRRARRRAGGHAAGPDSNAPGILAQPGLETARQIIRAGPAAGVQKEAETKTIEAGIAKIGALLPVLQERCRRSQVPGRPGIWLEAAMLQELQELVRMQQDILVRRSKLQEANAAVAALDETRAKLVSEYRHRLYDDLAKATQKAGSLKDEGVPGRAPNQFATTSCADRWRGAAIGGAHGGRCSLRRTTLAVVVPSDSQIEIEAMVSRPRHRLRAQVKTPRSRSTPSTSPLLRPAARPDRQRLAGFRLPGPLEGRAAWESMAARAEAEWRTEDAGGRCMSRTSRSTVPRWWSTTRRSAFRRE